MSIDIMSAVWKCGPENSTDRFVLLNLADRANEAGYCFPSYTDIAKRCAVSRPTAINAMNRLREHGWIRTEVQFKKDGSRSSNGIYINMERLGLVPVGSKESLLGSKESLPGVVKNLYGGSKESLPKSSIKHQEETSVVIAPPASPFLELQDHFARKAAVQPNAANGRYERDWEQPLTSFLEQAGGDLELAKRCIDAALDKAWHGNNGTVYTIARPASLQTFYREQVLTLQNVTAASDSETIWRRAIDAIARGTFDDERLRAAIRAVGAEKIQTATERTSEGLKGRLAHEYHRIAVPA
jgi:DNA-binding Lrp family transcriptional regulator